MKIPRIVSAVSAALLLSAPAQLATAGTLTVQRGPSFQPRSSFTDNTIGAELEHNPQGLMGDVVRLFGDSLVSPSAEAPRILIGGDFDANPGDLFSVVYDFTVNLGNSTPITLTLGAQTIVGGVRDTFNTLVTIEPGQHRYQGQVIGPAFSLATSGVWKGRLFFNFSNPGSTSNPDPNNLIIRLRAVNFQLTAVPEPGSVTLFGIGLATVGLVAFRRSRRLA